MIPYYHTISYSYIIPYSSSNTIRAPIEDTVPMVPSSDTYHTMSGKQASYSTEIHDNSTLYPTHVDRDEVEEDIKSKESDFGSHTRKKLLRINDVDRTTNQYQVEFTDHTLAWLTADDPYFSGRTRKAKLKAFIRFSESVSNTLPTILYDTNYNL